jgi:diguanylate cyclase (GGDEF)-like protein
MSVSKHPIRPKKLQNLYAEIAKAITSSLDFSTILEKIMEQIYLFFQPQNWSLLRLDHDKGELYFVICEGICSDKIKNLRLKLGEGVAGKVAETGKHFIVLNAENNSQFNNKIDKISGFTTTSVVAVPIIFQQRILGVIELINTIQNNDFSDKELEILKTIADFSAIAINNADIHEQIIFLATHDSLTQVYNRAFLDRLNTRVLDDSFSKDNYAIAILVDVDNFKIINDKFGHAAGDIVLIKMAELLKIICRKSDYVFRIGGDEFLVIISNINSNDLELVKDEIRRKLSSFLREEKLDFSYSFGIGSGKTKELSKVIQLADAKMYKVKEGNKIR